MCDSNSCLSCLAYICMVLGLSACLVAFGAPFWLVNDYEHVVKTGSGGFNDAVNTFINKGAEIASSFAPWTEGLFGKCNMDKSCSWVWENDWSMEKRLEDWQKASQGLYAGGVILIVVASLISTFHTCCCCCKRSFSIRTALGSLVFAAVLCIGTSLVVYGVYAKKTGKLNDLVTFYWGFYIGVGGVAACLLAAILYFIDGCVSKNYDGYHMTRVV